MVLAVQLFNKIKNLKQLCLAVFPTCYVKNAFIFGNFLILYIFDMDVTRNNLKPKVKSGFSLSGLMLNNYSNPYI